MSETQVAKVPRPKQLRRLLQTQIKRNLYVAIGLCLVAGATWEYFVAERRKQRYVEYHKNYDLEKEFERMRKKGLFQSAAPDDD